MILSHFAQSQQHVGIDTNYINHSALAANYNRQMFSCRANPKCLEFITADCQFLILGNIQSYHWLCGILHLSVTQLVSLLVNLVYSRLFYCSLCILYTITCAHVCIWA